MVIKIPKKIFGVEVSNKTLEAVLKDSPPETIKPEDKPRGVILPGNFDGNQYVQIPNTNFSIAKAETHKGKNWNDTHFALAEDGLFMPTPALFMSYLMSLKDAAHGRVTLYDGRGQPISRSEAQHLWAYNSSTKVGEAWTWLDAYFEKETNGKMWMKTDHRVSTGRNKGLMNRRVSLDVPVSEECFVKLKFTALGMPQEKSDADEYWGGRNIYFYPPVDGRVARFYVGSDGAGLYCDRDPSVPNGRLGVFACAEGTAPKNSGGKK